MAASAGVWLDLVATVTGACPHSQEFSQGALDWTQIWYVPGARAGRRNDPPAPMVVVADVLPSDFAGGATAEALTIPEAITVPSLPVTVPVITLPVAAVGDWAAHAKAEIIWVWLLYDDT